MIEMHNKIHKNKYTLQYKYTIEIPEYIVEIDHRNAQ